MSELTDFLKRGIERIEQMNKQRLEDFVLILGLLESFYAKLYAESYFIDLNQSQIAELSLDDPVYQNQRILNRYRDQVDQLIFITPLNLEEQQKAISSLKESLIVLQESIHGFSREI